MNLRPEEPIRPFSGQDERRPLSLGGYDPERLEYEAELDRAQARRLRRLVLVAAAFHVVLLLVNLPDLADRPLEPAAPARVFVVRQVHFQQPPPAAQREIPKPKVRRVPIPDPTPDDPEPIRVEEVLPVTLDLPPADVYLAGIPGPPGPPGPALPSGILEVGGEVSAPVKLHAPEPTYTEEARAARVMGVVILRTVVDADGTVKSVEVLKGLPLGMSESAVETVRQWRFRPATRNGVPVPVFYNLTISFTLQ